MARKRKVSPGFPRLFIMLCLALVPILLLSGNPAQPALAGIPVTTTQQGESRPEILVLHVYFKDFAERDRLAVELNAEEMATGGGFLTVLAGHTLYNDILARGLRVEIDQEGTAQLNNPNLFGHDNNPDTFAGGYRTVEEMQAFLSQQVTNHPGLAEVVDIGDSWCKQHAGGCSITNPTLTWNGYDILALHITNQAIAGPKPVYWFETGIHSREIATPEIAMRYISNLLDGYANDPEAHWLVDYQDIWVVPMVNPDGHHMVEFGGNNPISIGQRKNANYTNGCTTWSTGDNGSQLGTDNNRNFPFLWGCCGGSSTAACSQTYRGSSSGSDPETQAIVNKLRSLIPDQRGAAITDAAPITTTGVYQSMHSSASLNLFPWGFQTTPHAPNDADLRNMGRHMQATNAYPSGNGYSTGQPPELLYAVDGDTADWGYGELGAASYTTEIGGGSFYPAYSTIDSSIWPLNRGALIYQSKVARTPYLLAHGPDANNAVTNPMTVTQGTSSLLTANINYAWTGNAFSQNVAAAEYYIDTPPWAGGTAISMAPTDGTFNSPTEGAQATIDTTSLPAGRHLIFVRGRGVNNYGGFETWGPVSAAWLTVTVGGSTPTPIITGTAAATGTAVPPTATSTSIVASSSTATRTSTALATATCVPAGSTRDVSIGDFFFDPQNLTIPAGTTVRWTDAEDSHTTTSDTAVWDSGTLNPGDQFSYTFNTPGSYPYHCEFHLGMEGTITVVAGGLCATSTSVPSSTRTSTAVAPSATATRTNTAVAPSATATPRPPTQTPGGATATTEPPTSTIIPSATATACTISFTDVPPENVFYPFIRCLACRGIIGGYDDGTFRPFNDITRGQIAKIVSNAAGFEEDPGPQLYEDVPEGSPFYVWINRLSMRGHIGGYPCGLVPEEPCIEPDNLPYFRPSNSATRGQLSKIVANAAGIGTTPTGQFYTDVPEDHTFYLWIMRLTDLGVMSGYDCGGEGEPCDDENRPYFRPFNNVTRGQASKIVANTFFPGCDTASKR
jgi:carboxypeptidase T